MSEGKTFAQKPQKPAVYTENTEKLAPETERMFNDLLDYCDSIDTEVLFVLSPFSAKEDNVGRLNEAVRIAEERGYPVLNFNTKELVEDVGINWETDFYNSNHANILGAEKYTKYLANYIAEHYDMEDHRGDPAYKSWDESYESYVEFVEKKQNKLDK
ncbi:hypothetical protein [Zhenpiania hominis]|uniref:SGNH/GDSL hydrolase family protein n=1 Tax=Zhenpiania hominis TaxID=2763644 RepID=A0A923SRR2_9FIRM|nr:hypothetical protein [Zhenpiania hominis]MBC6680845.1 hypothetical protein [Zhenpiania hominis]